MVLSKTNAKGTERRRHWRVSCELPISYSLVDAEFPRGVVSRTVNMSSSGLMFPVSQLIAKERFLDLALALPTSPPISAKAEVRWTSKVEDMGYRLGVQFSEIRDEDRKRIADYIYR